MAEVAPDIHHNALWRLPKVIETTGLGRSSIYERVKQGEFPQPVPIAGCGGGNGRAVAWVNREVLDWVEEQIRLAREGKSR